MKVVAIVQARTGSTRFPGKVLADLLGEPMLVRQLERISRARTIDEVVVATTTSPTDDPIEEAACERGYRVFRGSESDVLSRYAQAATAARADVVVRLTGDCPLIDPRLIDETVRAYLAARPDAGFVSNALSETFPDGMDVEVFGRDLLDRADREAQLPSEREHVTFWFWKGGRVPVLSIESPRPLGHLRLTVDHPDDLELVRAIYERMYPTDPEFGLAEIVGAVHELGAIPNARHARNAGWRPSLERDRHQASEGGA